MSGWDILEIFLILLVLLGIMYLMLLALKKFFYSHETKGSKLYKMKVLSTQAIMPKKYVSIVKIQDKLYILGISDQSVNLIDKTDEIPEELMQNSVQETSPKSFFEQLKEYMGKR
jgi:flagellar protein FliO/FliZ